MDANTGKLLPGGSQQVGIIFFIAVHGCMVECSCPTTIHQAPGTVSLYWLQTNEGDLLYTPALQSIRQSSGYGTRTKSKPSTFPRSRLSNVQGQQGPNGGQPRPASPKYDERTFFFSNPYANEERMTRTAAATSVNSGDPIVLLPSEPKQGQSQADAGAQQDQSKEKEVINNTNAVPAAPVPVPARANAPKRPIPAAPGRFVSQISGPTPPTTGKVTPASQLGFKRTVAGKGEGLTMISVELHTDCR